ncbi:ATP synthase F1 subunit delta [Candidatus Pelagibacter sp.]|nr:ATP synthase F1 subunit delta [Candidatus Pelagibacter sp.]
MASLDDLKKRIASVKSTQKITKAMKMVAAAKLRRAQESAEKGRPYSEKMNNVILNLSSGISDKENAPKLLSGSGSDKVHLCVVMTSDRGLCGGFNSNIIKKAKSYFAKLSENNKFETLLKNFLSFLVIKKRLFYLEQILKSFIETCSKKRGELKAELKSAKELSEDEISKITSELTENFSSKIKLNYKHDESLIGGLIVQVGSTMVDTSIKNKLQQIENRMVEA